MKPTMTLAIVTSAYKKALWALLFFSVFAFILMVTLTLVFKQPLPIFLFIGICSFHAFAFGVLIGLMLITCLRFRQTTKGSKLKTISIILGFITSLTGLSLLLLYSPSSPAIKALGWVFIAAMIIMLATMRMMSVPQGRTVAKHPKND
jgi:hypothetical protein